MLHSILLFFAPCYYLLIFILDLLYICYLVTRCWGFLGGSDGNESACNAGDLGAIPRFGRSPGGGMAPHSSIFAWSIPWTEEPGGLLPWGCKESDTTEQPSAVQHNTAWVSTIVCLLSQFDFDVYIFMATSSESFASKMFWLFHGFAVKNYKITLKF